ncbi:MAG TPA: DNA-processing protein DprA [Candidatus Paceibacterota bacterium]|nr:DNA-processing protein DprA [Candidatus Paceibacterota bacterium]
MKIRELPRGEWPAPLLEIPQPPERLWLAGMLPPPGTKLLVVVGSRALSPYGRAACEGLIMGLAGYPVSIISGLALGTDACAHRAALAAGLHTIAIPGSGLDESVIYPRTNLGLAYDILAKGGALLSEKEPSHKPWLKEFPSRNRIMVGLADAVLIIEAGRKSGTLITARLAGEYNRELLCVPHRITDPHGVGPHLFIRLGAALAAEPVHVLEALGIPPRETPAERPAPALEGAEAAVWALLEEPRTRDELLRANGAPGETLTALAALEVRGLIREELGAWRRL